MRHNTAPHTKKTAWLVLCLIGFLLCPGPWLFASAETGPTNSVPVNVPTNVPTAADGTKAAATEPSKTQLTLDLKDLGTPDGYTLKTVKTERSYDFTRPKGWTVLGSSHIKVTFQHSPSLLPERSSLNILVNNRILKTISLNDQNAAANTLTIAIPPTLLKDRNQVTFQVDQHYTYDCEDPFSAELWTTLLPDTAVVLNYDLKPAVTDLAQFPYPLFDELGYGTTRIAYGAPHDLSDDSMSALATVVAGIGQAINWRPAQGVWVSPSQVRGMNSHAVLVGTPAENSAIQDLAKNLSGDSFQGKNGSALGKDDGVIQLVRNPGHPDKAILIISGNSPAGVKKAARFLVQNPSHKLLVGDMAVIQEQRPGLQHPFRAWEGFVQKFGNTFANLKLDTMTSRGITALPLHYKLKVMPDLDLSPNKKSKLHTVYSYSSQMDENQSALEVFLNGKSIGSVPLNKRAGEHMASFDLTIPREELYTYNDVVYQFHIFPDKFDPCRFVTDVHLWGTIHSTTNIEVPGVVRAPLPDVGLINDQAYPFTAFPDLSQVALVIPDSPNDTEMNTMVQIATRLGRSSLSKTGINLDAVHAKGAGKQRKDKHLIVIGQKDDNSLMKDLPAKSHLLMKEGSIQLKSDGETTARLQYSPDQGLVEELLSPWNKNRVVLAVMGETDPAMRRIGDVFEDDTLFSAIEPGNVVVMNQDGPPKSLTVLKKGDAKYFYPKDYKEGWTMPTWGWILLGFLAFVGLLNILRFLFGR